MLRPKVYRKLKGSIAIYILFWGTLCITMMILGFSLEFERRKNIDYLKTQTVNSDPKFLYREELFSDFYETLLANNISINQEDIDKFIVESYDSLILTRENRKLYFKSDKILILRYDDDEFNRAFECYKVKEINGRLKFIKVQGGFLYYNYDL